VAIEGPLKELGIQDVLQLLELARKTGVLRVRSEGLGDEALIHFNRGAIVFATRRRSTRRLGQQLLRAGRLTQRELDRALDLQRQQPQRRLAEILLEMGSVPEEELGRQLRFQAEEAIYDIMAWEEGHFRFEERADVGQERVSVRVRVESLLMEGARRLDEWTQLETRVPSIEAVPVLAPVEDRDAPQLDLRPEEWEVLAEIDGERDIRQLAANLGRSSFDVAKTVFGLSRVGVVEVRELPGRLPEPEVRAGIEEVRRLLAAGDAEAAARLAERLEASSPERGELALLAGEVLLAQGRTRAATEAFTRATRLDPLSPTAHYRLGFAAVRTGELGRAAHAWEAYLRLAPGERGGEIARALAAVQALNQMLSKDGATA
jgi:tetratricopeptide (TPR) repeat protein